MSFRRPFAILGDAVSLSPALVTPDSTQQKPEERRKLSGQEQEQVEVLYKLVDDVASGKPAPADVKLGWHNDFMKSAGSVVYAPVVIDVEQGKFTSYPVATYVRIVPRAAAAAPAAAPKPDLFGGTAPAEVKRPSYPFEDAFFFPQPKDGKLSRAFSVPAGEYDVYVAMKEKPDRKVPKPMTVVLKQPVTLPDLAGGLAVSSVIQAANVEPTTQVLTGERQLEQPYNVGGTRITPSSTSRLTKAGELSTIFFIYNAAAAANDKPDVDVEYNFHHKTGGAEKFFNKTSPQAFNAQTLPPDFSLTKGHQIIAFQSVPLASFPEGDYRLEIKVTDKANKATLTRDVLFTVSGS